MFKIKKIYRLLIITLTISFVIGFSAAELFAQRSGEVRYVTLKRNERKNTYKTVMENGLIYFEAENVEDPLDGTLLRGEKKLEYKCAADGIPIIKKLLFSSGRSNRQKVECLVLITPRIIIAEDS